MKKLLFSMFLLLCIVADAQHNLPLAIEDAGMSHYLQTREPATLTIQINNAPDNVKKTAIKYTLVTFGANFQVTKYTQADSNGFAKIILDQNLPYQQIWLSIGDYLYAGIYVNTGLKVTIDAGKIKKGGAYMIGDGIVYSGDDGELNTVMNKHILFKKDTQGKLDNELIDLGYKRRTLGDAAYLKKVDSIQQALSAIDAEFIRQYPKYGWAIKNETASFIYQWLSVAYIGDVMPQNLFDKINSHTPYFTSNDGTQFYRTLSMYTSFKKNNPKKAFDENILFTNYNNYDKERKSLLDSIKYYLALPKEERGKDSLRLIKLYRRQNNLFATDIEAFYINNTLKILDSIFTKPKADILKFYLLERGKNAFGQTYPEILNSMKTAWCKHLTENELADATIKQKKIDSLLASATQLNNADNFIGTPLEKLPFDADLYRLDSVKNIDNFILNLKSKFKGKAMVIDFWATWCGPCLADLPFSKKLHEANKDLPIAYIYICTNSSSNVDLWKNKVAGLQMPGTHIFMDEEIVAALKSSFNNAGSGFPTYVVIGIDGKLHPKAIQQMQSLDRDKLKIIVGL